ncbi:class I SAM-dependent methyltransferase [Undibacterium sp. TJN25]|uniref:class I SAM-dependent methyltransferase n=1 Tax=Undibacterium sp. TJN25 TaxID=3413056 RepID=UPI003BF0032C
MTDVPPLLREVQFIGSDVVNFACPHCGSTDRERHLFIYMSFVPQVLDKFKGGKVLHFAPERYLSLLIQNQGPAEYIKADMFPRDAEVKKINLEEIGYPDESFDFVIANHVLEHVSDDRKAIGEVHRVLKKGGYALLQTPYSAILPTSVAEFTPGSEVTRAMLFGEPDHVRLYGLDIFSRISESGLSFIGGGHDKFNIAVDSNALGINEAEPFFLFEK